MLERERAMRLQAAVSCGQALWSMIGCILESPLHPVLDVSAVDARVGGAFGRRGVQVKCFGCHEQVNPRIPPREALQATPSVRILRALDSGAMMAIACTTPPALPTKTYPSRIVGGANAVTSPSKPNAHLSLSLRLRRH
jgi:hypothetical protein